MFFSSYQVVALLSSHLLWSLAVERPAVAVVVPAVKKLFVVDSAAAIESRTNSNPDLEFHSIASFHVGTLQMS